VDVGDVLDPCEDVWRQWRTLGPSVLSRVQNHRLQVWQMDEALCVWLGVHVHVVDDVEAVGNVDLPLLGVVLHLLLLLPGVGRGKGKLAGCFRKRLLVGRDLGAVTEPSHCGLRLRLLTEIPR